MTRKLVMMTEALLIPSGEGATNRFLATLRVLASMDFDLTVIHPYRGWSDWRRLAQQVFRVVLVHPHDYYFGRRVLRRILSRVGGGWLQSKEPEVLASLLSRRLVSDGFRLVFDCHDLVDRDGAPSRWLVEQLAAELADLSICINLSEMNQLRQRIPSARSIAHIPCTISSDSIESPQCRTAARNLAFLGHMYYEPNAEALRWINGQLMTRVLRARSDVSLHVFGHFPESLRTELESSHVQFHGFAENIIPVLRECDVAISIMLNGTGFRVKVLHYLAAGLPIVANPLGVQGLEPGHGACVSASVESQADDCLKLLESAKLRREIADSGQKWLRQEFSDEAAARKYDVAISEQAHAPGCSSDRFNVRLAEFAARFGLLDGDAYVREVARCQQPWWRELMDKGRFHELEDPLVSRGEAFDLKRNEDLATLESRFVHAV